MSLYATNFVGVMNDNYLKMLVVFVAVSWVDPKYHNLVATLTPGMLVLPYLLFSPLAGRLPRYKNKLTVFRIAKLAEIPIMVIAVIGFYLQNIIVAEFAVLLMGLQSALYSPSKYGLIKDIGGKDGISRGMGGMEAVAFMGILSGTVLSAVTSEAIYQHVNFFILFALASAGVIFVYFIKVDEDKEYIDSPASIIAFIQSSRTIVGRYRGLNKVIHVLSIFWWLSASLQQVVVIYCPVQLHLNEISQGVLLAGVAVGISLGCVAGGLLDKKYGLKGLIPIIGLAVSLLLIYVNIFSPATVGFSVAIISIAFLCGIFKIPLDAEIQKKTDSASLSVVLAYFNLISFVYIFLASASTYIFTTFFSISSVFLFMAVVFGGASVYFLFSYKDTLCKFGQHILKLHYDIRLKNYESLKTVENQNLLLLVQHQAVIDPLIIFSLLDNFDIRPLSDSKYIKTPIVSRVLKMFDAVEVPDLTLSRSGLTQVLSLNEICINSLKSGRNILFYPSGHITLDGSESIGNRQLAYNVCSQLPDHTKVLAVKISGLWGSSWSRCGKKATPDLIKLLLKSILLICSGAIFFIKKRRVNIEFVDITSSVKSQIGSMKRREFNIYLENIYNN